MELLNEYHAFTGMQKDSNISKQPSTFLYNARNIRLTARNGETLLAITNEKGTFLHQDLIVRGAYLGHCLINNYLIVFSTSPGGDPYDDCITRFDLNFPEQGYIFKELYHGKLGFSLDYPIEAIGSYESEAIQKVYWTDGLNQPRMINITKDILDGADESDYNEFSFDFIKKLQLQEEITIEKQLGSAGLFSPGVIQYAFTYYMKHGQESNIFYTSPLLYISLKDRGAPADARVENSFKITISNIDTNFDYLRIYSIQRTSINGTPIVKRVQDINVTEEVQPNNSITFTDTGMVGDTIDPTELLYKGGEEIVAKTIEQKDNTLFLGNIAIKRNQIDESLSSSIRNNTTISESVRTFYPTIISRGNYIYNNQLTAFDSQARTNSVPCGGFKTGDYYRLGVQFQDEYGKWSNPIFIKDDRIVNHRPLSSNDLTHSTITVPTFEGVLNANVVTSLYDIGYRKARAVVVFPEMQDRVVLCQGVVCPTVYTEKRRNTNKSLYAQSSWFFRPKLYNGTSESLNSGIVSPVLRDNTFIEYTDKNITGTTAYDPRTNIRKVEIQGDYKDENKFQVDQELCTLHSPDIEFDDTFELLNYTGLSYKSIGKTSFTNTMSSINIQTDSPTINSAGGGFMEEQFEGELSYGIVSGLFYEDFVVEDKSDKGFRAYLKESSPVKWMVYPWNRTGSLNNDINRPSNMGTRTSILKEKVISNLRYSNTIYNNSSFSSTASYSFRADPVIFRDDQLSILKIYNPRTTTPIVKVYQGNVDTMLNPDYEEGMYFAFNGTSLKTENISTPFTNDNWWKTFAFFTSGSSQVKKAGVYMEDTGTTPISWTRKYDDVGEEQPGLAGSKEAIRMKYKSSAHLVVDFDSSTSTTNYPMYSVTPDSSNRSILPIVEIVRANNNND